MREHRLAHLWIISWCWTVKDGIRFSSGVWQGWIVLFPLSGTGWSRLSCPLFAAETTWFLVAFQIMELLCMSDTPVSGQSLWLVKQCPLLRVFPSKVTSHVAWKLAGMELSYTTWGGNGCNHHRETLSSAFQGTCVGVSHPAFFSRERNSHFF